MIKKLLILTALLFTVGQSRSQLSDAQQNDFCRVLVQMVEASRENFESLKKDRKNGVMELYYTSSVGLPSALDTRIVLRSDAWLLTAKLSEKKDQKQMETEFNYFSNLVKKCFKSWKQMPGERVSARGKSIIIKETVDNECGPRVSITMDENPTKFGYYKLMLSIYSN